MPHYFSPPGPHLSRHHMQSFRGVARAQHSTLLGPARAAVVRPWTSAPPPLLPPVGSPLRFASSGQDNHEAKDCHIDYKGMTGVEYKDMTADEYKGMTGVESDEWLEAKEEYIRRITQGAARRKAGAQAQAESPPVEAGMASRAGMTSREQELEQQVRVLRSAPHRTALGLKYTLWPPPALRLGGLS